MLSTHNSTSNNGPSLSVQDNQPATTQRTLDTNCVFALLAEGIGRLLIEKKLFQNANLPLTAMLALANDVIHMVAPHQKQVVSMAKEVSILYKQLSGKSLNSDEIEYQKYPLKEIDVLKEVCQGVMWSSMVLLGQSFVTSSMEIIRQKLWSHLPTLALYSGISIFGPQGVVYAVEEVLKKTQYSMEQKAILKPWLAVMGKLALGLIPKVHASSDGVHYRYPSLSGYSQTISPTMKTAVYGENVVVEQIGTLWTPKGEYPATYEASFKLTNVQGTHEQIKIEVTDGNGERINVHFQKIVGPHGEEIRVVSKSQELQELFGSYFGSSGADVTSLALNKIPIQEQFSLKMGIQPQPPQFSNTLWSVLPQTDFAVSAAVCLTIALCSSAARPSNLALPAKMSSMVHAAMLINLLFPTAVKASWFSEAWDELTTVNVDGNMNVNANVKLDAKETLEQLSGVLDGAIDKTGKVAGEVIKEFYDQSGKLVREVRNQAGEVIREFRNEAGALIREARDAAGQLVDRVQYAAGTVVREMGDRVDMSVRNASKEAQLIIGKAGETANGVIEKVEGSANKVMVNFGKQGKMLIEKVGSELVIASDEMTKYFERGAKATLKVAGLETQMVIGAAGHEARVTFETIREQVEIVLKNEHARIEQTTKAIVQHVKHSATEFLLSSQETGQVLIKEAGNQFALQTKMTREEYEKGFEFTITRGGKEFRLNTDHVFDKAIHTYDRGLNMTKDFLDEAAEIAANGAVQMIHSVIDELLGHTELKQLTYTMDQTLREGKRKHASDFLTLKDLVQFIKRQKQDTLSAKEKAALYVRLIKYTNTPKDEEAKKWAQFLITGIAYQDETLKEMENGWLSSGEVNHFMTTILPKIQHPEIKNAFTREDFSEHLDPALRWINRNLIAAGGDETIMPFPELYLLDTKGDESGFPIGSVIAYDSEIIPNGYKLCNGDYVAKDDYPDLFRVVGERHGKVRVKEDGRTYFKLPNLKGRFVRGAVNPNDPQEFGQEGRDTTRLPDGIRVSGGKHSHPVSLNEAMSITTTTAGEHNHILDPAGEHTHLVSILPPHIHKIEGGKHTHTMKPKGGHQHHKEDWNIAMKFEYGAKVAADRTGDGLGTAIPEGWKNTMEMKYVEDHVHEIYESDHSHTMTAEGGHSHTLDKNGTHQHAVSKEGNHSHVIQIEGHSHRIEASGEHEHRVTGGDEETRPKHINMAFMIKAKPVYVGGGRKLDQLQKDLELLKMQQSNPYIPPSTVINTLTLAALIGFILHQRRQQRLQSQ